MPPDNTLVEKTAVATSYNKKKTYPVLVGNTVRVYSTDDFASLPHLSKFVVKERLAESSKAKLVLKCSEPDM